MTSPCALFVDLRRPAGRAVTWPDRAVTLAYIVGGDLTATQDFFKTYVRRLTDVPSVTLELSDPDTVHLVTRLPAVTRVSLPIAWLPPGLADHVAVDAVVAWDHRRRPAFFTERIAGVLEQGVTHLSIYGLQDVAVWQALQTWLNGQGLIVYERFHAAKPGHHSPYQQHIAACGDIIAWGGWSRVTDNGTTRVKGPQATNWTTRAPATQREETLLLACANRHGVPLGQLSPARVQAACRAGLARVCDDRLCPTDRGLWQPIDLVACIL